MFIAVVSVFPNGLVGLYTTRIAPVVNRYLKPIFAAVKQKLPAKQPVSESTTGAK
jgi:hypothetical protein